MTEFGICSLSVIPVRAEPSEKSEMVTQLLFGDLFIINGKKEGWCNIRIVFDNYEGWIDEKMITSLEEEEFNRLNHSECLYTTEIVDVMNDITNGILFPVLAGSVIRNISGNVFYTGDKQYHFEGEVTRQGASSNGLGIVETAMTYFNAPYLWGGKTHFGIDCSGFTQQVFKLCGVKLLRDASQQATQGEHINFISEAEPGDLAFFDNEEGSIVHVGIILKNQKIIHASGKVRIDTIDHQGIINTVTKSYTHKLRLIKRII
jgi:hypothetical protein